MNILITGATGFIGQNLTIALLKKKEKVFVLVRNRKKAEFLKKSGAQIILGSLYSPKFLKKILKKIDIVYHLAALRGEWHSWKELYQNNVLTTQNLLEAALKSKIKHFIFISSVSVVGLPRKMPMNESFTLNPENFYAQSKVEGEKLVRKSAQLGLPTTIIRPSIVYGPGDIDGMILKLVKLVQKGITPIIGSGKNKIHLIYIDDLIRGLVKVRKIKPKNQIYIMAGEKPIAIKNLMKIIFQNFDKKFSKIKIPIFLAKFLGLALEKIWFLGNPPISRHKVDLFYKNQIYSIKKAKKELKFKPKIDYKKGIQKTILWYQKNGYL